jgi:putative ABC transport system permease protein
MTIIGIMGCSALIFTGLGLNDSISDITKTQYNKIILYQAKVNTNTPMSITNETYYFYETSVVISNVTKSEKINLLVVNDTSSLKNFINLLDTKGKPYNYDSGVLISENISNYYKIKEKDIITINGNNYSIKKVVKSYIETFIIIDDLTYQSPVSNNKAFINDITESELKEIPSITISSITKDTNDDFIELSKQISMIVLIVLISAITLAVVVTYNLTNINISERAMEIGTLKILGYKNGEVIGYVYREILIMTIIGALFGYLLGLLFERYILSLVDSFNLMLSRNISIQTLILSFLITLVVSIIVDLFMIIKLNKIKMISSLIE